MARRNTCARGVIRIGCVLKVAFTVMFVRLRNLFRGRNTEDSVGTGGFSYIEPVFKLDALVLQGQ